MLARTFLGEKIQQGSKGHCSIEDSVATVKLVKHKLTKGLHYGDAVMSGVSSKTSDRPELGSSSFSANVLQQCTETGKTACVIGTREVVEKYKFAARNGRGNDNVTFVDAESNKNCIEALCKSGADKSLNIAHVKLSGDGSDSDGGNFGAVDSWVQYVFQRSLRFSIHIIVFGGKTDGSGGCCFVKLKNL